MAYFLDNYPVSDECAELALTEEQEKYCRVVYKLDDKGGACFDGFWNPEAKYSNEYVVLPVRSTGCTVVSLAPRGTLCNVNFFANVIGSGNDPLIENKWWRNLWEEKANGGKKAGNCLTDGNFYAMQYGTEKTLSSVMVPYKNEATQQWESSLQTATCNSAIVGGHIIVNSKEATQVAEGGTVYILPICNKHNMAYAATAWQWGTGFYMKLSGTVNALRLIGYLKEVKKYLEEYREEVRCE